MEVSQEINTLFKELKFAPFIWNNIKDHHSCEVSLIDSEFTEKFMVNDLRPGGMLYSLLFDAAKYVIKLYSNLSVNSARNIFLFMLFIEKKYNDSVKNQINTYTQEIPEYQQFHSEIEKYLLLR